MMTRLGVKLSQNPLAMSAIAADISSYGVLIFLFFALRPRLFAGRLP